MIKRFFSLLAVIVLMFSFPGCARKTRPLIQIKHESVQSIDYKRTDFMTDSPDKRDHYIKTVTQNEDIEIILDWIESLKLQKHDAIEVPTEKVEYVITLNGVKNHTVVFFDNYVIYDATVFTYLDSVQSKQVSEYYNMLNYAEQPTEFDLIV